jgi:hypothetical protein
LIRFSPFNQKVQGSIFFSKKFKLKSFREKGILSKEKETKLFSLSGRKIMTSLKEKRTKLSWGTIFRMFDKTIPGKDLIQSMFLYHSKAL